ncbi:MAG TPA: hypothetical protein VNM22_03555 [Candidatus Limnocylindrales bacterium]|nr:hypothetical protein [Candidatus Limnocylindrales bacterium]
MFSNEEFENQIKLYQEWCEERNITEEEQDMIWNTMAMICFRHIVNKQGAFYEAVKNLLPENEEDDFASP